MTDGGLIDAAADWDVPSFVHAGYTLRSGGVSAGCYSSLNLALHVGDERSLVLQNRSIAVQRFSLPAEPVYVTQVHGTRVLTGEEAGADAPECDALVTGKLGLPLAIMTADCLPVLFFDPASRKIAAAHAGWRGLAAGVLEITIEAMGTDPSGIRAWLGPRIGSLRFEVGEEVRNAFLDADSSASDAFRPARPGHFLCSLAALAVRRLTGAGLWRDHISDCGLCTYSDPARFFSYRRDGKTGRGAAFIWTDPA